VLIASISNADSWLITFPFSLNAVITGLSFLTSVATKDILPKSPPKFIVPTCSTPVSSCFCSIPSTCLPIWLFLNAAPIPLAIIVI
jgi:hypothetical protein